MVLEFILNNVEFLAFIFFLTIFLSYKRKNLEIAGSFPILYMMLYKTKIGLDKMKSWSDNHPNIFRYISYLSIFIGILGVVASFIFMFWQLGFIIDKEITAGGGLVLPIKTQSGLESAVPVFYVPFWYWLIALFILVVVHEFAHGVIAQRWGVKVKSSGFAFLGVIVPIMPAAFVEPDEKDLEKKTWWQKIAVFGAGSLSNFIFGFLFFLIFVFVCAPFVNTTMENGPITFSSVMNESDLNLYGITFGEIIAFNNDTNKTLITSNLLNLSINETIFLTIKSGDEIKEYEVTTFENSQNPQKGMIGISGLEIKFVPKEKYSYLGEFPVYFQKLIFWIAFLNIGIGIMNLLPIWITDGGQITRVLLQKYLSEKKTMIIYNLVSTITLVLIFFTLKPSLLFSLISIF